jgi:hypothetical protein
MNKTTTANGHSLELSFHSLRNISSPEDTANSRKVLCGHVPAREILALPTNENVREYLVDAVGKKKRALTQVHRAIRETLEEHPDIFCVLNGGVTIVARESEVDESKKKLHLKKASIINGSQTQGVLRDFFEANPDAADISIKFELIVTDDDDLIAEISIARNFQNDVKNLSIAGRRGQLEELEDSLQKKFPKMRLQKSETERPADDNDFYQTEKLLQVIAALLPEKMWWKAGDPNKVYTYSAKATCLKDFQEIYKRAKDTNDPDTEKFQAIYQFYLEIAAQAYQLYEQWKAHPKFKGSALRSIKRGERGEIEEVPDGIIFPILASLSEFAVQKPKGWIIDPPLLLDDSELISVATRAYQEIAKSKPEIMGKTKACYTAVQQITSIYKKLATS